MFLTRSRSGPNPNSDAYRCARMVDIPGDLLSGFSFAEPPRIARCGRTEPPVLKWLVIGPSPCPSDQCTRPGRRAAKESPKHRWTKLVLSEAICSE